MIPKIIWQTYETDFYELPDGAKKFVKTWTDINPKWEYRYASGKDRDSFILENYGEEWHSIYNSYTLNALKADLWRYLVVYKFGGLYVDIDTTCNLPIEVWLKDDYDFIISAEPGYSDLTQMIFASIPEHPALLLLLNNIKDASLKNIKYDNRVEYNRFTTGYTILTKSITEYLGIDQYYDFTKWDGQGYNSDIHIFAGKESEVIHRIGMVHHRAGHGKLWKNYDSWLTIDWNNNE